MPVHPVNITTTNPNNQKTPKLKKIVLLAIIVIVIALLSLGGYYNYKKIGRARDAYRAVFLTNGQVYFGKVTGRVGTFLKLSDVFYLQKQDSPSASATSTNTAPANLTLTKLGNELHGPKNQMEINKKNILFIEELSNNSKVLDAIKKYKN